MAARNVGFNVFTGEALLMSARPDHLATLLAERGRTHGQFDKQACIAQALKTIMATGPNWERLTSPQREVLEMIAHKIGRILAGDPGHVDPWGDIAGYATLVVDPLRATISDHRC